MTKYVSHACYGLSILCVCCDAIAQRTSLIELLYACASCAVDEMKQRKIPSHFDWHLDKNGSCSPKWIFKQKELRKCTSCETCKKSEWEIKKKKWIFITANEWKLSYHSLHSIVHSGISLNTQHIWGHIFSMFTAFAFAWAIFFYHYILFAAKIASTLGCMTIRII